MADLGLAQLHDMRTNAEMIANLDPFGPPLIADMDHGYGGVYTTTSMRPCAVSVQSLTHIQGH